MISNRTKRLLVLLGLLLVSIVLCVGYFVFMLTRNPGFDGENTNIIEAREAHRKLKAYEKAVQQGRRGWFNLSQLEVNSYLTAVTTNEPPADERYHLRRVSVGLTTTNATLFSWINARIALIPVKFCVQRTFHVTQHDTNMWNLPMDTIKIGEVEIPRRFRARLQPMIHEIDKPLVEHLSWATNIQMLAVAKDPISQRPVLRLFTYRPAPAEDLR